MSSWNPVDQSQMALPPCHVMVQFYVAAGELSCMMTQRSGDLGLGIPFNIASYALLTHLIAHVCGLKSGDLYHVIGDAHVYLNHVEPLAVQLVRQPRPFPKLQFVRKVDQIDDFITGDFVLTGYSPHPAVKMEMAI